MKQVFALAALFFLTFGVSFAQEEKPATEDVKTETMTEEVSTDKPIMTLASTTVDYGEIAKSSDPLRSVSFTNTGNAPLIIKHAKGSCGCTVPNWPKEPILPGETSQIEIRYDTKRVGPIRKTVRITTNEGDEPHILQITGLITAEAPAETVPVKEGGLTE